LYYLKEKLIVSVYFVISLSILYGNLWERLSREKLFPDNMAEVKEGIASHKRIPPIPIR